MSFIPPWNLPDQKNAQDKSFSKAFHCKINYLINEFDINLYTRIFILFLRHFIREKLCVLPSNHNLNQLKGYLWFPGLRKIFFSHSSYFNLEMLKSVKTQSLKTPICSRRKTFTDYRSSFPALFDLKLRKVLKI